MLDYSYVPMRSIDDMRAALNKLKDYKDDLERNLFVVESKRCRILTDYQYFKEYGDNAPYHSIASSDAVAKIVLTDTNVAFCWWRYLELTEH